ncbi:hypothetical protein AXF42_Ash012844 [Apostasia shenzhenica]|uniref:Ubiquitin-conjugating enzyme E2C-binding protein n=1 Tax=Apostasia shenzhenica TaxID=1088818 RepID=A0A2I0AMF0_9ASPA|nr:hypothetical protein AXF42_Ash012844 [Apostasia shenzhenica]
MSFNPEDSKSTRRWRFTWEALAHIPTLRLYLFNPELRDLSDKCHAIGASLSLHESLLLVSWSLDEDGSGGGVAVALRVPIPRVLIDPGCPVDVRATGDHIEAKLALLLPVDHPVVTELCGVLYSDGDRRLPLSLGSDIEKLSSEGVNIFCKSCSTKLTRQPIRNFVEMPSMNWREVADNWFGACCCSFGGASEKLVLKYLETFNCCKGTCLLDRASIIVHKDDIDGSLFQPDANGNSSCSSRHNSWACDDSLGSANLGSCQSDTSSLCHELSLDEYLCNVTHEVDPSIVANTNLAQHGSDELQGNVSMNGLNPNLPYFRYHSRSFRDAAVEMNSEDSFQCCVDETRPIVNYVEGRSESKVSVLPNNDLQFKKVYGSGFMNTTTNLSNDIEWIEFCCRHCSSPLGSYPSASSSTAPIDGGIRLLKCYISTSACVGDHDDTFKNHTFERIFTNVLLEGAQDELSFRMLVSDMRTKSPMLHIVLMNSRTWYYSEYCFENTDTRDLRAPHMQPVVKVLFCDSRISTEASSRIVKEWSAMTHTEEVYMMTREIEELRKLLESSMAKLPGSCCFMQGMFLSFLER